MKIVLETIPVWDGVKEESECFLCSLMKRAESDALSYYLSSAIMTPEVRVETNTYGFCKEHLRALARANKPQVLALMMDTYYEENKKHYNGLFRKIASSGKVKIAEKNIESLENAYKERNSGCLICTRMEDRLYRYAYTIAALFEEDPDFKKAFSQSKGLCFEHTIKTAEVAKKALKGDVLLDFYKTLFSLLETNLQRVQDDDYWMTQMYKSENKGKDWKGCEDAQKRAVYKLVGEVEVYDPIKNKKSNI